MMLTSGGQRGDAARCRELGIAAYLTKPISHGELWEALIKTLGKPAVTAGASPIITRHTLREGRPNLRILLAEDNLVNQKVAVSILEKQGHLVTVVGDGQAVLTALEPDAFDLVLMDVQMPILDGLQTTAAIRARERTSGGHIPIVAMTARAMKGDQEECLAAGMDGYVSKPLKRDDLEAVLMQVLGSRSVLLPPADEPPIDLVSALGAVDGDRTLLREVIEVFCQDYPSRVTELRDAIDQRTAPQMGAAAHSLKGALSIFGRTLAFDLAQELETRGRAGHLDPPGQEFTVGSAHRFPVAPKRHEMDLRVIRLGDEPRDHPGERDDLRLVVHRERVVGHGGIRQKGQTHYPGETGNRDLRRHSHTARLWYRIVIALL